jgi:hypothetical protein
LLGRWIDEGVAPLPAQRAGIPADYLDLISRRSSLVDRLAARSEGSVPPAGAGTRPGPSIRQVSAQLVDALAASLFVDDPLLFHEHLNWLVDMLDARGDISRCDMRPARRPAGRLDRHPARGTVHRDQQGIAERVTTARPSRSGSEAAAGGGAAPW